MKTTTKKIETTTAKVVTTTAKTKEKSKSDLCKKNNACEQICKDEGGKVKCECQTGYRLLADGKSCKG